MADIIEYIKAKYDINADLKTCTSYGYNRCYWVYDFYIPHYNLFKESLITKCISNSHWKFQEPIRINFNKL